MPYVCLLIRGETQGDQSHQHLAVPSQRRLQRHRCQTKTYPIPQLQVDIPSPGERLCTRSRVAARHVDANRLASISDIIL